MSDNAQTLILGTAGHIDHGKTSLVRALTGIDIRFLAPGRPGTSVSLELTVRVRDEDPGPRRGNVDFDAQVVDEGGKIVIEGVWHTLMGRRPSTTS